MIKKVCLIQPVQSPYWTQRLKVLAQHKDLEIFLLLERDSFSHRLGWNPEPIDGVKTVVLGSRVRAVSTKHDDLDYHIDGVRTVPFFLSMVLLELKPDVVVACNATQVLFALPARLRLGFHLSLIVEDTPHATRNLPWHKMLVKKGLYRRADSWLPFSDDAVSFLKKIGIERSIYRSCWSIDADRFRPCDTWKTSSAKLTVSAVAALTELKGIIPLLREWSSIPQEVRSQFRLRIAGTGPLELDIKTYLVVNNIDDVELLGQIPYEEIVALFQSSSLFVLPTLQDLCSLTILEAMACGCPVITTPYNGARDLVEDGVNGWIADPARPGDLAYWLTEAMSDPDRLRFMGGKARQSVLGRDNKQVMRQFAEQLLEMSGVR